MPTRAEFQAFRDELPAQKRTTRPKLGETLLKRWPEEADRMAFYGWSSARANKRLEEREMTNISPEELTEMLATMNFNDDIARGRLLLPDQQDPKTDRELASINVLDLNTNIQPKDTLPGPPRPTFRRRAPNLPSPTTQTIQASYSTRSETLNSGVDNPNDPKELFDARQLETWFPHTVPRSDEIWEERVLLTEFYVIFDF
ncbi:MAG: hypothetical protein M1839_007763 [Geoglossum umbratile]|nr:MAG: hypothetical protein M1839_007763 [Geoglossum umbratile]